MDRFNSIVKKEAIMKQKKIITFLLLILLKMPIIYSMQINRVILSTDNNPNYIEFWPMVAKAWTKMGVRPTLALIAEEGITVDESLGDVIRFDPIHGISNAFYTKTIRLLMPCLFPDDISIISDIDQLPLNKSFFFDSIAKLPDDCFVSYNSKFHEDDINLAGPMCYHAAKGSTFREIFKVEDKIEITWMVQIWHKSISNFIKVDIDWFHMGDEVALGLMLKKWDPNWKKSHTRWVGLDGYLEKTIWWEGLKYDLSLIKSGFYNDVYLPRPYHNPNNKNKIDQLLIDAGLEDLIIDL